MWLSMSICFVRSQTLGDLLRCTGMVRDSALSMRTVRRGMIPLFGRERSVGYCSIAMELRLLESERRKSKTVRSPSSGAKIRCGSSQIDEKR